MNRLLTLGVCLACISSAAKAHEFWIDPVDYTVEPDEQIVAALRVGQEFVGSSYAYIPMNFRRFDYIYGDEVKEVPGTIGDRPALTMDAPGEGLVILVHATTDYTITWDDWQDFVSFVEHKDAAWTLDAHTERGLEIGAVREVYSRYAKSLVAVGDGAGEDREVGLLTEIVALENPYTDDMSDGLDIQVLYEGAPRVEEQVEIFAMNTDAEVEITTLQTDADGKATIPVVEGQWYQLDSVVLREPAPEIAEEKDVAWESLWANLTFYVPER